MTSVHGMKINGGSLPASIFQKYMSKATRDPRYNGGDFPKPDSFPGKVLGQRVAFVEPQTSTSVTSSPTTVKPKATTSVVSAPTATTGGPAPTQPAPRPTTPQQTVPPPEPPTTRPTRPPPTRPAGP
jgi:membrane peptidoglycan carboxypeptidase